MKKTLKSIVRTLAFACAALACVPAALASAGGDIVDIRVMDDPNNLMYFNGVSRNTDKGPYLCSADHPLTAGDRIFIRMRMVVRNALAVSKGLEEPQTWTWKAGALGGSALNRPKLGLYMGEDRPPAFAEFSDFGPQWQQSGELKTDDLGHVDPENPNGNWRYYTDFYFVYTIQAGDLSLPIRLLNGTGSGPASDADVATDYYILNYNKDGSDHWFLGDSKGNVANLFYGDGMPQGVYWPEGDESTRGPVTTYDLHVEGAYAKTIDFGPGDDVTAGCWRTMAEKKSPKMQPSLLLQGGESKVPMTVYLWSKNEAVAELQESGNNKLITTKEGLHVLKIPVAEGATSVTFAMKAADAAREGDETEIYLSPVASIFSKTETGVLEANTVFRKVKIGPAEPPEVIVTWVGPGVKSEVEHEPVTADADYQGVKGQLQFKLTEKQASDVTVKITATVGGETGGSLNALYEGNLIRIPLSDGFDIGGKETTVTIRAGQTTETRNLYVLGASEETEGGIYFRFGKQSGPADVTVDGRVHTIVLERGGEESIEVTKANPEAGTTVPCAKGESKAFKVQFTDTYKNITKGQTGYKGYTFTLTDIDSGDELARAEGVKLNNGWFTFNATIDATPGKYNVVLSALAPDGASTTESVAYELDVADSKHAVIVPKDGRYTICEGEHPEFSLSLNRKYSGDPKYLFVKGVTEDDQKLAKTSLYTIGAEVDKEYQYVSVPQEIEFLDGKAGGTPVHLSAFLGNSQTDPTDTAGGWGAGNITVTVTNKPPAAKSLVIAGQRVTDRDNGKTLVDPVSSGVNKSFRLTNVDDVEVDLASMDALWVIDGQEYTTHGHPTNATSTVTAQFLNAKPNGAVVQVYLKDKDMSSYPADPSFECRVVVLAKPYVEIRTSATGSTFLETDKGVSQVSVSLSEAASSEVVVRFKLTPAQMTDGGYLKFRTADGSVTNAVDAAGKPLPGEYDVVFAAGVKQRVLIVDEMDGTNETLGGFDLSGTVITETENPDGVKWKDYFMPGSLEQPLMVRNVAPEIIRPTDTEAAYTNMNASAGVPYPVYYGCKDVAADMATGVVVTVTVDGTAVLTTNVTDTAVRAYDVTFDGEGVHVVEISFTDKDQMSTYRSLNYYVRPSKRLQLRAHGPARALGTTGGYSMHYAAAPGLGAGWVYAGSKGPQSVKNFVHTYSFGELETGANAYAAGYRVGDVDDGNLGPIDDRAITPDGNLAGEEGPFYNYTNDVVYTQAGRRGFDSFVYGWACNNTEASSGSTESANGDKTTTTMSFLLNVGATGETIIPLPASDGKDENSQQTAYPIQYWEAVFSRELFKEDNCGDINLDGVPDIAVYSFGLGIVDTSTYKLVEGTDGGNTEGDLTDVSEFNKDVDKDGAEDPDYLPSTETAAFMTLIPGLKDSWAAVGQPFGARLEVRGFHDGLNDALDLLGITGHRPEVVYAEPFEETDAETGTVVTNWKWTASCTISDLEFAAWSEFAAANGLGLNEWANADGTLKWSPERPTNPMKSDTDGDGFSDGYEYYFWYKAHVGYWETQADGTRVHRHLSGRRYDPRNPGEGRPIRWTEIAGLMDPLAKSGDASSADTRDTDGDGIPDLLEFEIGTNPFDFDTDGDGLPDGWEVMISATEPLAVYTTQGISDAMRNYDGDAMAFTTPKLERTEVLPKPLVTPDRFSFALVDAAGDSDGIQWYVGMEAPANVKVGKAGVACVSFKIGEQLYVTTSAQALAGTFVTADGRLAVDLEKTCTWEAVASGDEKLEGYPELAELEDDYVRLMPAYVSAGTQVDVLPDVEVPGDPEAEPPVEPSTRKPTCATLVFAEKVEGVNAAWIYGRANVSTLTTGAASANLGGFGMLAVGRNQDAPAEREIAALPTADENVAYVHFLVYQEFGFDPRTAWNANTPLAARWGSTEADGSAREGSGKSTLGFAGTATRTREYTTYDEFLVYSFFLNNGSDLSYVTVRGPKSPSIVDSWFANTTNPQGPGEPNIDFSTSVANEGTEVKYYGRNSDNGADTDLDGVPDGWELYVMGGPKDDKGRFFFVAPYGDERSVFSPFVADAAKAASTDVFPIGDSDGISERQEFAGTDSCNYYSVTTHKSLDGNEYVYSDTVVRPEEQAKWLNKFFPTDPWNTDTDGDGIDDGFENKNYVINRTTARFNCGNFVYGEPGDDGKLTSIPGGGLNPCSVDTDQDGLPDAWEAQYAGNPSSLYAGDDADFAKVDGSPVGNALQGLTDGMDGTVKDAYSYVYINKGVAMQVYNNGGVKQVVDRDYDHDGLDNWQEYLTSAMRCWRYDDPYSAWQSIPNSVYYDGEGVFNPFRSESLKALGIDETADDGGEGEFWYKTLVDKTSPIYNPHLVTDTGTGSQYFTRVWNEWDPNWKEQGAYYIFHHRIGKDLLINFWGKDVYGDLIQPWKYIGCSPVKSDTDGDGMDDYYELFHGLNPLLGDARGLSTGGGMVDVVYDAWYDTQNDAPFDALKNRWTENARGLLGRDPRTNDPKNNKFDFELFPWLAGLAAADADGDDLRNQSEAIMAMLAPESHHTDPSALWLTDSSYTNSLVSRFYRLPATYTDISLMGGTFEYNGQTFAFTDCDGFYWDIFGGAHLAPFTADHWSLTSVASKNWFVSFEENEGYDTDHDGISDFEELQGRPAGTVSDPQNADAPHRRQAMYFPGENAALQTMPFVREEHPRAGYDYQDDRAFLEYTVECWVRPEDVSPTTTNTVLERAIWSSYSAAGDEELLRKNFQLGIRNGCWYTKFDANGTLEDSLVELQSDVPAESDKWTHLAATYDGAILRLFVNGTEVDKDGVNGRGLTPEYGASAVVVRPGEDLTLTNGQYVGREDKYWKDAEYPLHAIVIGASAKTQADFGGPTKVSKNHLDVTNGRGWDCYKDFFKGYVDEVRIWDGARTADKIRADMTKRYTSDDAKANREDVYDQWSAGRYRYDKATDAATVVPELRYHWSFDSLPAAENAEMAAKQAHGYGYVDGTGATQGGAKAPLGRPADYEITWWKKVLDGYTGTVYGNPAYVTWVPNTVTHLPRFDGTTLDSAYWTKDVSGVRAGSFSFANTAEPVSRWTQYVRRGALTEVGVAGDTHQFDYVDFKTTSRRFWQVNVGSSNSVDTAATAFEFAGRHLNQQGDDLLPLGGAFVKYVGEMWDDNGPSSSSEITGTDDDNNGLADWWEAYAADPARGNYRPEETPMTWTTFVTYDGRRMTAGEAYLLDLAKGLYADRNGNVVTDDETYRSRADEDKDGMPDWWEKLTGIHNGDTKPTPPGHADDDPDNDGLSNYQEYLVSYGTAPYGLYELDPSFARSGVTGQTVTDYYLPVTVDDPLKRIFKGEYLGEVLSDHDFVENWWENKYAKTYASAKVYDPWDDTDGDGWSNFAECRASLWGHSFMASLIDSWTGLTSDMHVTDYPEPIIGVRVTYEGQNDVSGSQLVIRTRTGQTPRTDATFVIPAELDSQVRYLNTFEGGQFFHGHLSPGQINPNSVVFEYARYSSDKIYQWNCDWYKENAAEDAGWDAGWWNDRYYSIGIPWSNCSRIRTGSFEDYRRDILKWPKIELEGGDLKWEAFAETQQRGNEAVDVLMNGKKFGTVDATTGEFALDMTRFAMTADYREYVFRVTYTSRTGHEWPQTVYVSDTKELATGTGLGGLGSGHVREGSNTVEAFFDLNGNKAYDAGEPYGMVKNVQVGWHKVPEVTIELTDESKVVQRMPIAVESAVSGEAGAGGEAAGADGKAGVTTSQKVRIVRESINGATEIGGLKLKERTVMSKEFVMDDRAYLTEADVLSTKKPDLDWQYLRTDAEKYGITSLDYVTYRVESHYTLPDGSSSNTVIGAFTREFGSVRPLATAVAPIAGAPVYSSAPTFRFTAGEDATAFAVQVETLDGTTKVYDSGVQMLGGRSTFAGGQSAYAFTAPIYAGASAVTNGAPVFEDGKSYRWRVAAFNAKFTAAAEADYSAWEPFQMDVCNANRYPQLSTGYGRVGAIVRYFGPAKTNDLGNLVVVEAFANADFTGQAMAQARVSSTDDLSSVTNGISALSCTNALLTGVDTGVVYLRAYIDLDNNGRWDRYEPWGYANMVGEYGTDAVNPPIYNPKGVEVGASEANLVKPNVAAIFIEDTDWNKNEIPDCLEDIADESVWPTPPIDPTKTFEIEDSDGGGAPDDWEEGAGTDPNDPADEASVILADDVMACMDVENVLLVRIGATEDNAAWYAVMDPAGEGALLRDGDIPLQTDAAEIKSLVTTWSMTSFSPIVQGTEPYVGIGTNVTFQAGKEKVIDTTHATVRLVHAQVYAANGYETGCAAVSLDTDPRLQEGIAAAKHPHTKAFTVLDKFLVCRYLESIGVSGVSEAKMFEDIGNAMRKTFDGEDWDTERVWKVWRKYTLDPNAIDGDRDDIADGWELYTMFGQVGLGAFTGTSHGTLAEAKVSPFDAADGFRLTAPTWGDPADPRTPEKGLLLVEEFDGGYYPTDPWSPDTDRDTVIDYYAYQYHLKGGDAGKDFDLDDKGEWVGDGLSNYAEYLISEVFKYAKLDPEKVCTSDGVNDYFRKMGDLYLGEIFSDHDQIDDAWEGKYADYANRDVYDPDRDDDLDGWSNYTEFRAGTDPTKKVSRGLGSYVKQEYPIPAIEAKVVYNGADVNLGALVFKAWSDENDPEMTSAPDAIWTFGAVEAEEKPAAGDVQEAEKTEAAVSEKYVGPRPNGVQRYVLGGGAVTRGSVVVKICDEGFVRTTASNDVDNAAIWYAAAADKNGKIVSYAGVEIGSIDYDSGLLTLDCSKLSGAADGNYSQGQLVRDGLSDELIQVRDRVSLDRSNVLITWNASQIDIVPGGTYYLGESDPVTETAKSHGHVREGLNTFMCFADTDNSGDYTPGEPYGIVRGVDVGWQGAKFTVELTETAAITERIRFTDNADDRKATIQGTLGAFLNDRMLWAIPEVMKATNDAQRAELIAFYANVISNRVQMAPPVGEGMKSRVRIVRYGIDDMFCYSAGVYDSGFGRDYDQRVVLDKVFDMNGRDFLSEADFLGPDAFDIDWETMTGEIVDAGGYPIAGVGGAGLDVTNMTYLIVVGDGAKDFRGSDDTNTVVSVAGVITRRFERHRSIPACVGIIGGAGIEPAGNVYTAHPTFVWSMPNEDGWASQFGSTYTSFKIRIYDANNVLVYESAMTRAPAQDDKGRFAWTAPISVGGQTPQGKVFANNATYTWRVSMYNAKFQSDSWSPVGTFSTLVNAQSPMNDTGSSSIGVTVKYTGPEKTLYDRDAKVWICDDLTKVKCKVRVQAFETADFNGLPAAETQIANRLALTDATDNLVNGTLTGLKAGTYHIRAYIDSNGNFQKDDFESWGYAKEAVTVGPDVIRVPTVSFFIEDADTNGNWYPDAWEYQHLNRGKKSWDEIKGSTAAAPRKDGEIVLSSTVYDQMVNGLAGISTGLSGSRVTIFQDAKYAELLLDPEGEWDSTTTTFGAIRKAIEKKIVDKTLKVTAITLDAENNQVILAIDAELDYANLVSGKFASQLYDLDAMGIDNVTCTVKVKVYKKSTLAQADWELVDEVEKTFGRDKVSVPVELGEDIDLTSGFYKVEVVQ